MFFSSHGRNPAVSLIFFTVCLFIMGDNKIISIKPELCVAIRNIPRPAYIHGQPSVWPCMLGGWFRLSNIVDELGKFYYALTALPSDVAPEMHDFAIQPPTEEPYTQYRKALTARTGLTNRQHIKQLFKIDALGDLKFDFQFHFRI